MIPCLNDRQGLETALLAVSQQDCRRELRVIAADNGSSDGSREVGERLADVTVVCPQRGAARARNAALTMTETPFVITLDADCVPINIDWASRHIQALRDAASDIFGSAGDLIPLPGNDGWAQRVDVTPHPSFSDGAPLYAVGANACYRTEMLKSIGGFPLYQADDSALGIVARKNGLRYRWTPAAAVFHRNAPGWRGYYRQMYKVGGYVAELHGPPRSWPRYFTARFRDGVSTGRHLLRGEPREMTAGVLRVMAQMHGALDYWRHQGYA